MDLPTYLKTVSKRDPELLTYLMEAYTSIVECAGFRADTFDSYDMDTYSTIDQFNDMASMSAPATRSLQIIRNSARNLSSLYTVDEESDLDNNHTNDFDYMNSEHLGLAANANIDTDSARNEFVTPSRREEYHDVMSIPEFKI